MQTVLHSVVPHLAIEAIERNKDSESGSAPRVYVVVDLHVIM